MQTGASSSLAPDRIASLHPQSRPATSGNQLYHIATTLPSEHTRRNRASYHPPSTYRNYEWDLLKQQQTASPVTISDDQMYTVPFSQLGSASGRPRRAHTRRSSISDSIKNGFSTVRSLGRRMSLSMKNKRANTTDDRLLVPDVISPLEKQLIQLEARPDTVSVSSNRPKSIIQSLRARRRPSMPIIKYGPGPAEETPLPPFLRSDSCRTESFHRAATMPQRPDYLTGGAGARASAAAQNEALQLARATPLPPYRPRWESFDGHAEYRDSESGIGIVVWNTERSESRTDSVARYDPVDVLATELLEHILSFLDAPTLCDLELVSRRWRELCHSQTVWRQVFYREYAPTISSRRLGAPRLAGMGRNITGQDYRKLYSIRKAIDKRWEEGKAAAIYLNGHKDSVYCVQFDEDKIITGSRDNTIRVWDARTYQCIRKLAPPNNPRERNYIIREPCEPEGVLPFTTIKVESAEPRPKRTPSMFHQASILCLQYDNDLLVTGSSDFTAIVWSIKHDYRPIFRLVGHKAGVLDICMDAKRIITCSKDTTIKIWNRNTGALISTLKGHRGPVNSVQVRNNLLASASGDGMAKLWRLDTGMCIKEFHSRERGLACVEFSEDGRTIFAGGNDHVVYEYDTTTANVKRELKGHTQLVRSLHLDTANGRIISGSYDHSIKVWDLKNGTSEEDGGLKLDLSGWTSSWMLAAKSNYRKIACAGQDGRVLVVDFGWGIPGADLVEADPDPAFC